MIHLNQAASPDGPPSRAFIDGERDLVRLLVIPRRLASVTGRGRLPRRSAAARSLLHRW
jgi:hypothetical protein